MRHGGRLHGVGHVGLLSPQTRVGLHLLRNWVSALLLLRGRRYGVGGVPVRLGLGRGIGDHPAVEGAAPRVQGAVVALLLLLVLCHVALVVGSEVVVLLEGLATLVHGLGVHLLVGRRRLMLVQELMMSMGLLLLRLLTRMLLLALMLLLMLLLLLLLLLLLGQWVVCVSVLVVIPPHGAAVREKSVGLRCLAHGCPLKLRLLSHEATVAFSTGVGLTHVALGLYGVKVPHL